MSKPTSRFGPYTGFQTFMNETDRLIHDGMVFIAGVHDNALVNGADLDVVIETPADKRVHLQALVTGADGGPDTLSFYEGTTASADGTVITGYNKNRNSDFSPTVVIREGATVSAAGTLIDETYYFAATNKAAVLSAGDSGEWILKPSEKYLLRWNNGSGGNADIYMRIVWFEHNYDT